MPTSSGLYDTSTLAYDASTLSYDGFPVPLANMPAVGVFIAWTDTPYTVSPAWTEISQYVRSINIRRGRSDDLQQFPPGTASLVLDNSQRLFDPFNTSGTWYSSLKPRKAIKIVANWNGVEYPLYRGYVAGWPVEYTEGGLDSTVTIDCFDMIGLLAAQTITSNAFFDAVMALNPNQFFTLDQRTLLAEQKYASGEVYQRTYLIKNYGSDRNRQSNITVNSVNYTVAAGLGYMQEGAGNSFTTIVDSIVPGIDQRAISLAGTELGISGINIPTSTFYGDNTVAFWYKLGTSAAGNTLVSGAGYSGFSFQAQVDVNNRILVNFGNSSSRSQIQLNDNAAHFIVCTSNAAGETRVYVDGRDTTTVVASSTSNTIGFPLDYCRFASSYASTFQYCMFFNNKCLTADEVSTLYARAVASKIETGASRLNFYMNDAGIPADLYSIDSNLSANVDELPKQNNQLLPEIRRVLDGYDGSLVVTRAGVLTLTSNTYLFNQTRCNTSQATFTDTGTGVKYDTGSIRLDFNADQVRNNFVVNASFALVAESQDATSIAANGIAGEVLETILQTVTDAQTLGDQLTTIYKNPKMSLEPFMAKGQANPSYNWPKLLALELLDRITFVRTPSVGSAITKDLLVQSVEHRITPNEWQTVVNGSARYTNWFIIGTSLIGGDDLLLN